jgi:hypothetical protein
MYCILVAFHEIYFNIILTAITSNNVFFNGEIILYFIVLTAILFFFICRNIFFSVLLYLYIYIVLFSRESKDSVTR